MIVLRQKEFDIVNPEVLNTGFTKHKRKKANIASDKLMKIRMGKLIKTE